MWTFLRRLWPSEPPRSEVLNRLDDFESRLEYLAMELKKLRGRVTGAERVKSQESATEGAEPHEHRIAPPGVRGRMIRGF